MSLGGHFCRLGASLLLVHQDHVLLLVQLFLRLVENGRVLFYLDLAPLRVVHHFLTMSPMLCTCTSTLAWSSIWDQMNCPAWLSLAMEAGSLWRMVISCYMMLSMAYCLSCSSCWL